MRYWLSLPLIALAMATMPGRLAAQAHDHSATGRSLPQQQAEPADDTGHSAMDHSAPQPASPPTDHSTMDHGAMDHSQMDHSQMDRSQMDQSQMDHGAMDGSAMDRDMGPAATPGPPPRAFEGPRHAADELYGLAAMVRARETLVAESGGVYRTSSLLVERLEARLGEDDAFLWDVQGFVGADLDRLVLKSEGEGEFGNGKVDDAEIQALWSHAIGPWVDLQAGARLDIEPETRGHAVLGVQGLAPFMIHFDAAAFLSERGDLTARIEAEYDQKITQRLILQPRIELDLAAQDIPERGTGAGLSSLEAGLRLRYEIVPEFAPYVGVEWERRLGATADIARANGEDAGGVILLAGIRTWF